MEITITEEHYELINAIMMTLEEDCCSDNTEWAIFLKALIYELFNWNPYNEYREKNPIMKLMVDRILSDNKK
jgi:hypothetical protein